MPQPARQHRLKILHTMTWLAPGGGADKNVWYSINGLNEEHELHLSSGVEIFRNEFAEIEGLPIHVCPHLYRNIRPLKDLQALWWYYRLIRREKYDIVHTHEGKSSLVVRVAAWLARTPYVIFGLHGVFYRNPQSKAKQKLLALLEKLTIWMNDSVVSVSQTCLEVYHGDGLGRKLPYDVVYSGVDTQKFVQGSAMTPEERIARREQIGYAPDDVILINIGRFAPSKAQHYTIKAFAKLRPMYPKLKLLLIGNGDEKENCIQLAKDLGVDADVNFYGFSDDIPGMFGISDINVLTSLREGLPRVVVEASLCKRPTVAFEVEGLEEILLKGSVGTIVPQHDVDALAHGIDRYLKDPELAAKHAAGAQAHAQANWDISVMVQRLREIYQRIGDRIT